MKENSTDIGHFLAANEQFSELCQRYRIVLLEATTEQLFFASDKPLEAQTISLLQFAYHRQIEVTLWPTLKLEEALQNRDFNSRSLQSVADLYLNQEENFSESLLKEENDEPVVKFLERLLLQAVQRRVSDIHFEPYKENYRIRFRIDGVLQCVAAPPYILGQRIAARLKVMANLDIAEKRLPQDGLLCVEQANLTYSMRISTLPIANGEKIVLRVLKSDGILLRIDQLGMSEELQQIYINALSSPQGLILVTGPTGSGKSITLYSGLNRLNQNDKNLCSVEDPIEIPLPGVNQTQVNSKTGLLFNKALRAFLRQDPDIIMVGEIRDKETAEIAVSAAQTGHLVLSTLHTNSTTETIIRLLQIGLPAYQIAETAKLIIAQRLVRKLCSHCLVREKESVAIKLPYWRGTIIHYRAVGCNYCLNGYYQRTGVYETLRVDENLKTAILNRASSHELHQIALQQGNTPLFLSGLHLVEQGVTSLEELFRVLGQPSSFFCQDELR